MGDCPLLYIVAIRSPTENISLANEAIDLVCVSGAGNRKFAFNIKSF